MTCAGWAQCGERCLRLAWKEERKRKEFAFASENQDGVTASAFWNGGWAVPSPPEHGQGSPGHGG